MARQVQTILVDDIDGGKAEEMVTFALDGAAYEIDLSSDNAQKLRDALAPFVDSARKTGRVGRGASRGGGRPRSSGGGATADREQNQAIREWAKNRGHKVSPRGRIPAHIVEEYHSSS